MNLKSISDSHQAMRNISLITILVIVLSNGLWAYAYVKQLRSNDKKVYIDSHGGTYPARLVAKDEPTIFEARNLATRFTELMFGHDEMSYAEHIEAALHLIDKPEGIALYEDFEQGNILDNYIKYGSRSVFECDSVYVDMNKEPYEGKIFGRQIVMYAKERKALPIGATFTVIRNRRSDTNPYGLLLQDWKFVMYSNEFYKKEKS